MEEVAVEEPTGLTRGEQSAARELRFAELVERHSRFLFRVTYAMLLPTLDVLAECFEPRDALGSLDEYSEDALLLDSYRLS
jgi:hypothetical protein